MAEGVLMPKAGITVESCIIGEWKKNVGDAVNVGDVLFTYDMSRLQMDLEAAQLSWNPSSPSWRTRRTKRSRRSPP